MPRGINSSGPLKSTLVCYTCNRCNYCGRVFTSKNSRLCDKITQLHMKKCRIIELNAEQLVKQKTVIQKELLSKCEGKQPLNKDLELLNNFRF